MKQVHRHTDAKVSTQPGKAGERQLFQTWPSAGHLENFLLSSSLPAPAFKGSWAARKGSRGPRASCFNGHTRPSGGGAGATPRRTTDGSGAHPHHWQFTGASAKNRTANSTHSKLWIPIGAAEALRPGKTRHLCCVHEDITAVRIASQVLLKCRLSRPWRISAQT